MPALNRLARNLRNNPTEAERKLWRHLQRRQLNGFKFRRQQEIESFIVDFVCFEKRLIVELDGGQHNEEENLKRDAERTRTLESKGFLVLRFWNNEVLANTEGVLATILDTINPSL